MDLNTLLLNEAYNGIVTIDKTTMTIDKTTMTIDKTTICMTIDKTTMTIVYSQVLL